MTNENKENNFWFYGLLIIGGIIYCIYYTASDLIKKNNSEAITSNVIQQTSNTREDFEIEKSCGKDGLAWANKYYGPNTQENTFIKTFHFNKKLNICLAKTEIVYLKDYNIESVEVYDIYTQKQVNSYMHMHDGSGPLTNELRLKIIKDIENLMSE